jgi:molybdopterin-guanine dinucleotide biosynthesis protein A
MGRDKALLAVAGERLLERALAVLASTFSEVILVSGSQHDYPDLGWTEVKDRHVDCGPLAGLEAALAWAAPRPVFVLACDLPRVDRDVVALVSAGSQRRRGHGDETAAAVVARRHGRLQPLCGLYNAACAELASRLLNAGDRSVHRLLAEVHCSAIDFDDVEPDPFLNVNTPADYARAGGPVVAS